MYPRHLKCNQRVYKVRKLKKCQRMNHGVRFMKYYTGAGTIKQTAWQRRYNDSDSARTDRHQTRLPSDHHLQDDANTNTSILKTQMSTLQTKKKEIKTQGD